MTFTVGPSGLYRSFQWKLVPAVYPRNAMEEKEPPLNTFPDPSKYPPLRAVTLISPKSNQLLLRVVHALTTSTPKYLGDSRKWWSSITA